jgi:hypothetical protein
VLFEQAFTSREENQKRRKEFSDRSSVDDQPLTETGTYGLAASRALAGQTDDVRSQVQIGR